MRLLAGVAVSVAMESLWAATAEGAEEADDESEGEDEEEALLWEDEGLLLIMMGLVSGLLEMDCG